ncbi:MAG TPA: hypothetical protein VEH09_05525, partial [Thermodesulfobacteriota bacterium]|nr:hypothetical protein [Thermodesulfobacteriota bacterium]
GIIMAILSIYFYFRVVVALFMRPAEATISIPSVALTDRFAGGVILFFLLLLGLVPSPVFTIIEQILPLRGIP